VLLDEGGREGFVRVSQHFHMDDFGHDVLAENAKRALIVLRSDLPSRTFNRRR
jgi:hypothetical protein